MSWQPIPNTSFRLLDLANYLFATVVRDAQNELLWHAAVFVYTGVKAPDMVSHDRVATLEEGIQCAEEIILNRLWTEPGAFGQGET